MTIIQVSRPDATNSERDPRISWFVYLGQDSQEGLAQIALLYGLRFCQEHGYRFDKQALLWTEPRLRTPEQFDRWSQVVAIVHNLIAFARQFIEPSLHPWENMHRDPTPQQVLRGLAKFLPQLGTPAPPPKPRGNPKGRKKGAVVRRPPVFPSFAKRLKYLKSFQRDGLACHFFLISSVLFPFYGTSREVLVLAVSLNIKYQ